MAVRVGLFSATMSQEIVCLASDILKDPARVQTAPPATVAMDVEQKVLFVEQADKGLLLAEILKGKNVHRALVFTRTKHRADRLMRTLSRQGFSADAIHSNKSQNARQRARVLVDVRISRTPDEVEVAGLERRVNLLDRHAYCDEAHAE